VRMNNKRLRDAVPVLRRAAERLAEQLGARVEKPAGAKALKVRRGT